MYRARAVLGYDLACYRRSWRGSAVSSFVSPLFFLAAMGVGLGGLVQQRTGTVGGVDYLSFLAPGLLAAACMQTAMGETTYPVMGRIRWTRTYEGMLATPVRVVDVVTGELAYVALRMLILGGVNLLVMTLFGVPRSPLALLVIAVAPLVGLAFGAPILAFTATQANDVGFAALNRFVILPLFLLGGAFFPLSQLPSPLQGVAWLLPLSHGVALMRSAVLGEVGGAAAAGHLVVLLAYAAAGAVAARMLLQRRLVV